MLNYLLIVNTILFTLADNSFVWQWNCIHGQCKKVKIQNATTAISFATCQLLCNENSVIWPKPTGELKLDNTLLHININSIDTIVKNGGDSSVGLLFIEASKRFKHHLELLQPNQENLKPGGFSVVINANINDLKNTDLYLNTPENYNITSNQLSDGRLNIEITAENFYGARHGLETLSQLFIYDDIRNEIQTVRQLTISDEPKFKYRGLIVDTSRNYVSVERIKRTIDAMAMNKMNTFHWHLTDTQSFPFVAPSLPFLAKTGAYSPYKVYTPQNIKDIIHYGKVRGVRIVPEFDAPAHVGEGWLDTGLIECFSEHPFNTYCAEPPCGIFNPIKNELYDLLDKLYADFINIFEPTLFHMGGDEVKFACWNKTQSIIDWMDQKKMPRTNEGFHDLWNYFQTNAYERLYKNLKKKNTPIILWTSTFTEVPRVKQYLDNEKYIIQVWTLTSDNQITNLLANNYSLILSTYDTLYLDCGFDSWLSEGNNWCSPYHGWKKIYKFNPTTIAYGKEHLITGAEAAIWTEQADGSVLDSRVWPRTSALAERLWSDPKTDWSNAFHRILIQRDRLVQRGIEADVLQPEWCLQNEGSCY